MLLPGCANGSKKKTGTPDVMSSADQIEGLQRIAKAAAQKTPAEQEQMARLLAASIQKENDSLVRAEIVRTLGYYNTDTALAVARAALKDPVNDVRIEACAVLGKKKGPQAVSSLSESLGADVNFDVRLAAARALGETKDRAAQPALGIALEDPDPAMQYCAVESLKQVTGKDLGNDVARWRQYVKGEAPAPQETPSLAERLRRWF
jgi:HEAT repeat protein